VQLSPPYDADGTAVPLTVKAAHPAAVLLFLNVKDENVDSELSNCSNPMT
jgi:hypothetical protein